MRIPSPDSYKINIAAALYNQSRLGAIAVIIRDHQANFFAGPARKIIASSPLMTEAKAMKDAMLLFRILSLRKCVFESDNLELVLALC